MSFCSYFGLPSAVWLGMYDYPLRSRKFGGTPGFIIDALLWVTAKFWENNNLGKAKSKDFIQKEEPTFSHPKAASNCSMLRTSWWFLLIFTPSGVLWETNQLPERSAAGVLIRMGFLHSLSEKQLLHCRSISQSILNQTRAQGISLLCFLVWGWAVTPAATPTASSKPIPQVTSHPMLVVPVLWGRCRQGRQQQLIPSSIRWGTAWTQQPPRPEVALSIAPWQQLFLHVFSKTAFKQISGKKFQPNKTKLKGRFRVLTSFLCYSFTCLWAVWLQEAPFANQVANQNTSLEVSSL